MWRAVLPSAACRSSIVCFGELRRRVAQEKGREGGCCLLRGWRGGMMLEKEKEKRRTGVETRGKGARKGDWNENERDVNGGFAVDMW